MQVGLPGRNVTLVSAPAHASSSEPPGQPTTRLGIVIVTRNLFATLLGTLARLPALPEAPALVVVDNASTDDTIAAVRREFPAVAVIALTRNHGGVARNYGVRHLDRECIAFADPVVSHHHPSARRPNMRERYVKGISDRRWEAWARRSLGSALRITGRQLRPALTDPVSRAALRRAPRSLPPPPARARVALVGAAEECGLTAAVLALYTSLAADA